MYDNEVIMKEVSMNTYIRLIQGLGGANLLDKVTVKYRGSNSKSGTLSVELEDDGNSGNFWPFIGRFLLETFI